MKTRVIQPGTGPADGQLQHPEPVGMTGAPRPWRRGRVTSLIARRPVTSFFVLAFALTWMTMPMGTFMAAGPLIASLIVLGVTEGKPGVRALGRRMIQWRVRWPFYVVAV